MKFGKTKEKFCEMIFEFSLGSSRKRLLAKIIENGFNLFQYHALIGCHLFYHRGKFQSLISFAIVYLITREIEEVGGKSGWAPRA